MNFEVKQLTPDKYNEWDDFCAQSRDAWFWHTSGWIDFIISREPEALESRNLSFFVYHNIEIKAVVPLAIETHNQEDGNKAREFSFERWAIPSPVFGNDLHNTIKDREARDVVQDFVFGEIDRLARENKVKRASFNMSSLAPLLIDKKNGFNYLMKFGYNDISLNAQIIDLRKPIEELEANLRRNHRRNIKKASDFKFRIYTEKDITREIFNAYKEMHHKAAGRKTRSNKTFELMYDWLRKGLAFLSVVELNNNKIGFEYYNVYKNNVYGNSAANDPEFEERFPIRHFLEWKSIQWMKSQGFSFYEIGLQQYGTLFHDFPDKKQLDISHFKKGFGGFTVPWFAGEKYYDKDYFLKINKQRADKYANFIE